MISVPMADHDVVDLFQAGFLRRGQDSLRVAVGIRRESRVEEERFSRRRYDQGCGAAFDIDPVKLEIAGLCGRVL